MIAADKNQSGGASPIEKEEKRRALSASDFWCVSVNRFVSANGCRHQRFPAPSRAHGIVTILILIDQKDRSHNRGHGEASANRDADTGARITCGGGLRLELHERRTGAVSNCPNNQGGMRRQRT